MTHNPIHFISRIANCNSSSSHAMVKAGVKLPIYTMKLADKNAKMCYLNAQVNGAGSVELVMAFINKYPNWKYDTTSMVDHQSQIHCPRHHYYKSDATELVLQFFDLVMGDDVDVIIAGDEYTDTVGERKDIHPIHEAFSILTNHDMLCVRHSDYGWVLFADVSSPYVYDQTKYVLKMRPDAVTLPYTCDIKITNYCTNGCEFCYQNSHRRGEHATLESIKKFVTNHPYIIEYAIGGGEPTKHPQFDEIIDLLRSNGKRANFTTREKRYFRDNEIPNFTGVALSAENTFDVIKCAGILSTVHVEIREIAKHIHLIAWPHDMIELSQNMETVNSHMGYNSRLVLLAPKLATNPKAKAYWKNSLRKAGGRAAYDAAMIKILNNEDISHCLAVDTPIMREYKDRIDYDPMYHFTVEGEFSMYHDAITGKSYNSSYELDKELKDA